MAVQLLEASGSSSDHIHMHNSIDKAIVKLYIGRIIESYTLPIYSYTIALSIELCIWM